MLVVIITIIIIFITEAQKAYVIFPRLKLCDVFYNSLCSHVLNWWLSSEIHDQIKEECRGQGSTGATSCPLQMMSPIGQSAYILQHLDVWLMSVRSSSVYRTPLSLCNALFNTTKPCENFHIPTSKHSIDIVSLESVDKDHQAMSASAATKAPLAEAGTCRCVMDGSTKRLSLGSCTFHCLLNSFIMPLRKQAHNCLRKIWNLDYELF